MRATWRSLGFTLVMLLVGLLGFSLLTRSPLPLLNLPIFETKIQRLYQRDPVRNGAIVYVRGIVGDRVPLINQQVYQLQDGTGSIWVLTDDATLQPGDEVLLKGRVYFESISIANQEFGEIYIEAQKQLKRNSTTRNNGN
jgi:hypothetical protein